MNESLEPGKDSFFVPRIDLLITDKCNMACPMCFGPSQCNLELTCESILRIANMFRNLFGTQTIIISGGEPTLHSQFPDVLTALKEQGFEIALHTNGKAINDLLGTIRETVSRIVLPLDGPEPYVHGVHRGDPEHFATIVGLLRSLELVSGEVQIGTVLTSKNQHCVNELLKFVYETSSLRRNSRLGPLSVRLYRFKPGCKDPVNNNFFFLPEKAFNMIARNLVNKSKYRHMVNHICGYHHEDSKCLLVFPNGDLRVSRGPSTVRVCNVFNCSGKGLKCYLSRYRVDTRPHSLTKAIIGR